MKETKSYLKTRWQTELKAIGDLVTHEIKHKGDLNRLDLPRTANELVDLRGFSAPKKYTTEKSNSGRDKTYVSEGIRIKKMSFENIDFSYSDFEECEFYDCIFSRSKFDEARFVATNYSGCKFHDIAFVKTNFGHSTFQAGGIIFKKIKDNFKNVIFELANFSEVHVHDQTFQGCQFSSCKTGALILSKCILKDVSFSGTKRDLFFMESREIENVDFTDSILSGLNLEKHTLDGFHFPEGDTYYKFSNKSKELANLRLHHLNDEEKKLVDTIIFVWSRNNLETDFVDVNWLKEDEIETGKLIIKELKKGDNKM